MNEPPNTTLGDMVKWKLTPEQAVWHMRRVSFHAGQKARRLAQRAIRMATAACVLAVISLIVLVASCLAGRPVQ